MSFLQIAPPGERPGLSLVEPTGRLGAAVPGRSLEWWGAGLCLLLLSGAIFPVVLSGGATSLDDDSRADSRALLRGLVLTVYAISAVLMISLRYPESAPDRANG